MEEKVKYGFWRDKDYGPVPTKQADLEISANFHNWAFQNSKKNPYGVYDLAGVQDVIYFGKGPEFGEKQYLGNLPFFEPWKEFFPKEMIEKYVAGQFNFQDGGRYGQDIYHLLGHIILEAPHSLYGEQMVICAESVIYGHRLNMRNAFLLDKPANFKPVDNVNMIRERLEDRMTKYKNNFSKIVPELDKYDFALKYELNEHGQIDLEKSPEVLALIIRASYVNHAFLGKDKGANPPIKNDNRGNLIGDYSGNELCRMDKNIFRPNEKEKQEISQLLDYNTNPASSVELKSLSQVAQKVQGYIEILKISALKTPEQYAQENLEKVKGELEIAKQKPANAPSKIELFSGLKPLQKAIAGVFKKV